MSLRIDTAEWISGALVIGNTGGGVLAENVAHSGTDGDGYLYNDVTLPDDAGKEICGRITSVPAGLHLFAYEDGSTIVSADSPGSYTAMYQLYVDYVATGSPTPISYTFGAGSVLAANAWTEGPDAVAIAGTVIPPAGSAAVAWTEGADTVALTAVVEVKISIGWAEGADASLGDTAARFNLSTIMRQSIINTEVTALLDRIAAQGGTMRAAVGVTTVMRADPISSTGTMRATAINRTVEFI
jgi:hypothetical protein